MSGKIIDLLRGVSLPNVFNPYVDACPYHDSHESPYRRSQNLIDLIDHCSSSGVDSIWFGRDLGYLGGRRTGIAFTDEYHLESYNRMMPGLALSQATLGPPIPEKTARMIWDVLARVAAPVFLWNIFPFHPHEQTNPLSNRCHTRHERKEIAMITKAIIEFLKPRHLVAVGNDAAIGLRELGYDYVKLRHPSYGGKADFVRGANQLYGLPPPESDLKLL